MWINLNVSIQGESIEYTEVYYFDDNGNLVLDYSMASSMGGMSEYCVYDKQ